MECIRKGSGKVQGLDVSGKLDAYWSDALSNELESCVHDGAVDITLNLSQVSFISSAGLRVLIVYLKQMRAINGILRITEPSQKVRDIFDLSGLSELLLQAEESKDTVEDLPPARMLDDGSGSYYTFELVNDEAGELSYTPEPDAPAHQRRFPQLSFPSSRFGFGIGAFGDVESGARTQFGEFLSAAGITVCVPSDERAHPDYMIEDGVFVPSLSVYSGIAADAVFARELRFEAAQHVRGLPLSAVARLAIGEEHSAAAVLMIAETVALIGTTLKISPEEGLRTFSVEDIRGRYSFTTEPSYQHCVCVVSGVVSRHPAPYLRPLHPEAELHGHAHAAVFSYRPLPAGQIDPHSFIRSLYDEERIHTVLHLLYDDRNTLSSVESEFVRGSIFVHPLRDLQVLSDTEPGPQDAEQTDATASGSGV
ncbi:MAG: hypothetical protein C0600_09415 [Ignavibacteria bacterium]|nr:MAG: hypothetical protein C0600_09415 [Ignavibacteria bacterium]